MLLHEASDTHLSKPGRDSHYGPGNAENEKNDNEDPTSHPQDGTGWNPHIAEEGQNDHDTPREDCFERTNGHDPFSFRNPASQTTVEVAAIRRSAIPRAIGRYQIIACLLDIRTSTEGIQVGRLCDDSLADFSSRLLFYTRHRPATTMPTACRGSRELRYLKTAGLSGFLFSRCLAGTRS